MIHVSDLIAYQRCPRFSWNRTNIHEPFQGFYHMEAPFSRYWMEYFSCHDVPSGKTGDSNEDTLELLKNHDRVINVRMEYKGCRTRIPLLEKCEDGYKATYMYLNSYPKESESLIMKINQQIAASIGIQISQHQIFYLNKEYVRQDQLDIQSCFLTSNQLFNRKNKLNKTIEQCMEEQIFDLDTWISQTQEVVNMEQPPEMQRSKQCTSNRRCMYYDQCFDDSQLPDNSVLFLTTSQNKMNAFHNGIKHIHELDLDLLDGFRLQYAQYIASQKGRFVDGWALHAWLHAIEKPVCYLDFEWDTFAIPPYKGMKPFDVLCFQYSLHIEPENEPLYHKDFFDTGDCREAFIQSLLKDIPEKGAILVYNMEGAEKLRLQQLAVQFPQYKEQLDAICDRMVDLSKPFEAGLFYDNKMRGHYSLKNVLPVFTDEYSYKQLNIQDGMDAVFSYRNMEKVDKDQQEQIRESIRKYCRMDTYAEVIIYHGLMAIDKEMLECQI